MTIYIFADSFGDPTETVMEDDIDFRYYNLISKHYKENIVNFSKRGSGPDYAFKQFFKLCDSVGGLKNLNGNKFIFLLSAPERVDFDFISEEKKIQGLQYQFDDDYDNNDDKKYVEMFNRNLKTEFSYSNHKNLMFLYCLSEFFLQDSKFFVNVVFDLDENPMQLNIDDFRMMNSKNFWIFKYPLSCITVEEMKNTHELSFDEPITFRYKYGEKIYIHDYRPNHLSEENHRILAQIIIDFFETGKINHKNPFKKNFLDENSNDKYFYKMIDFIYD